MRKRALLIISALVLMLAAVSTSTRSAAAGAQVYLVLFAGQHDTSTVSAENPDCPEYND